MSLKNLINAAYRLTNLGGSIDQLITGGPNWVGTDTFDIEAKAEDPEHTSQDQLRVMLQNLLIERFNLKFHREKKEMPGFDLVVAKSGLKMKPAEGAGPGAASANEGVMKRIVLLAVVAASQLASESQLRSDAEIRQILAERLEGFEQRVGIVVGVIGPNGRKIFAAGSMGMNDPRPVDGDTLFEAGSITKAFTSLLLADMVERGEVALDDPVAKYLPVSVKMPARNVLCLDERVLQLRPAAGSVGEGRTSLPPGAAA